MITKELLIEILNSPYRWDLIELFMDDPEKFNTVNTIWDSSNNNITLPKTYQITSKILYGGIIIYFMTYTTLAIKGFFNEHFKEALITRLLLEYDIHPVEAERRAYIIRRFFTKTFFQQMFVKISAFTQIVYNQFQFRKPEEFHNVFNEQVANLILQSIENNNISLECLQFIQKFIA